MTDQTDEYRWLEEIDAPKALDWVRERNAASVAALTSDDSFTTLRDRIRQVLDAEDRIPYPGWRGDRLYNFWQDAAHPRGLWRRTTIEAYRRPDPDWEVLLDVDALAAAEGENWVWEGAHVLRPDFRHCLVSLSRGGADAAVVREYDLVERAFVADGFVLPEAKSDICWIDRDTVFVGTDFGPGTLTSSGYPRVVKRWRRGTPIEAAETVFEGQPDDVSVYATHDPTPGFERDFVGRALDFFRSENFLLTAGGELIRVPVPLDADWDAHREWLLVRPRTPWEIDGVTHPAGSLLAIRFDDFMAGGRDLTVLFRPDDSTALSYHVWTRDHLLLATLRDVRTELSALTPGSWERVELPGAGEYDHTGVVDTEPDHSDDFLLTSTGFLRPQTLSLGRVGGQVETLKQAPEFFDTTGMRVRQHFATSADGTRVPYFLVGPDDPGAGPTLLAGYGGFEVSLTPGYDPVTGRGWLAGGGTYVMANIRGGGEYGPAWHRAALRDQRPRAYEDFAAVARDLVDRGICTPDRLGIEGGSNGGLLMGVMLTRYPELFGAVVAHVPLLDMRRYHLLLAGASWMAEYGDPDEPQDWAYLREFSPYQNVRPGRSYPPLLLVTSTRDDRVHPGHARKMAARMHAYGYDVSYYENIEGGHGAAADNEQRAFVSALTLSFLWRTLTGGPPPGENTVGRRGSQR